MFQLNKSKLEQLVGAVIGFLTPLIIQLASGDVGWSITAAADAGVVATWLLAHAHVSAPASTAIAGLVRNEVTGLTHEVAIPPALVGTHKLGLAVKKS